MRRFQNFDFLGLKNLSPGQFCGAPTQADIIKFENYFLQLKNQMSGSFWKELWYVLNSESMHLVQQKCKI